MLGSGRSCHVLELCVTHNNHIRRLFAIKSKLVASSITRNCFVFLISLLHQHHSAFLHHHALTFLMALSTHILKPSVSHNLSIHSHLSRLTLISWNFTTRCLAVTGGGSIGDWYVWQIKRPVGL